MESLADAGLVEASFDVVVSNCVINLASNKREVFSEILRVLAPGGELYFSDIYSDRRLPAALRSDAELVAECVGDALYRGDFLDVMDELGVRDVRRVRSSPKRIDNPRYEALLGETTLHSETYRVFKLPFERRGESYGQSAVYRGTVTDHPDVFVLDADHAFPVGVPVDVCGNTALILSDTRFASHFELRGDRSVHLGACVSSHSSGSCRSEPASCC